MTILIIITFAALAVGMIVPTRWGLWGFIAAAALIFTAQVAINTSQGFAEASISDSIQLYFNGDFFAYLGYNAKITYRAFAGPLLVLAGLMIYRLGRLSQTKA